MKGPGGLRNIVCLLLISAVVPGGEARGVTSDSLQSRPNIILIVADDLGYGDLGCYGNKRIQTPNLDLLAREGVRLTDFHSNGAVCSPTRAALLTGRYQQRAGISMVITAKSHRHVGLPLAEVTIAEVLKTSGYVTGAFGKWHLGYEKRFSPVHQGFDEFMGYVSGNIDYHSHVDQEGNYDWWEGDKLINQRGYSTDLISKNAIDFIRRNKDNSFFLYIAHQAPHYPFQNRTSETDRRPGDRAGIDFPVRGSETNIPPVYKDMIEIMDETIGNTLKTLEQLGLDSNTIIIFCSDNGASPAGSNGVLKGYKGSLWEGGHRVPAIFRWPGHIGKGAESVETVLTMDIFPTILELSGIKNPVRADGISIARLLLHNKPVPERTLFWQHTDQSGSNHFAVRKGKWKLVIPKNSKKPKLYDLENDIREAKDVADKYPGKAGALLKELEAWKTDVSGG